MKGIHIVPQSTNRTQTERKLTFKSAMAKRTSYEPWHMCGLYSLKKLGNIKEEIRSREEKAISPMVREVLNLFEEKGLKPIE